MLFTNNGKKNYFLNKTINITLTNLGQYIHGTDSQIENVTSATWKIEAPLSGNSSKYSFMAKSNLLGNTGISVEQIQLSPLSVNVTLKLVKNISYNMIPTFEGVKMKNGTIYLCGMDNTLSSASKKPLSLTTHGNYRQIRIDCKDITRKSSNSNCCFLNLRCSATEFQQVKTITVTPIMILFHWHTTTKTKIIMYCILTHGHYLKNY